MSYYSYIRVSSKEQKLDRQIKAIKDYCKDNDINFKDVIQFQDKQSGKDTQRPQYQALRNILRKGDTLIVKELDRLGRNKDDIKSELGYFSSLGVTVRILDIPSTLANVGKYQELITNLMIELIGTFAQEEREKIKQRQKEGIEAAKRREKSEGIRIFGKPLRKETERYQKFKKEYRKYLKGDYGKMTKVDLAKFLGMSKVTLFNYINEFKKENNS